MTETRNQVLGSIRRALGRGSLDKDAAAALEIRLDRHQPNVIPARGQMSGGECIDQFVTEAEKVNATTVRVTGWKAVPTAISSYLKQANLPAQLRLAPDPTLKTIPWDAEPLLEISEGVGRNDDPVSVTGAFAGVAETGSVVLLSGPESPTTLNFLPDTHIVVMATDRITGNYEDVWRKLRSERGAGVMPRVVNWITGPSRTADIEQSLLLGAHGPRRLHIVLVDD